MPKPKDCPVVYTCTAYKCIIEIYHSTEIPIILIYLDCLGQIIKQPKSLEPAWAYLQTVSKMALYHNYYFLVVASFRGCGVAHNKEIKSYKSDAEKAQTHKSCSFHSVNKK